MKFLDRVRQDLKNLPHDERQQAVQQQSSWKAMIALIIGYMAIGGYYAFKLEPVPWSTQAIFFLAFVTYAYLSIKQDGLSFVIPGMTETEETFNQPAAIRSIPWITFFGALIAVFIGGISGIAAILKINSPALMIIALIALIMFLIFMVVTDWAIARQIKRGNPFWIYLIFIGSILNIFGYGIDILHHFIPNFLSYVYANKAPIPAPATAVFFGITTFWNAWVIAKYHKQMIGDGKSFKKVKEVKEPKSPLALKRELKTREIAIVSLTAFALGFICLAIPTATIVIAPFFFFLAIITLTLAIIRSLIYD